MPRKRRHELKYIALIYWRCSCGEEYRREGSLKGISDDDLALETHSNFEHHCMED